MHLKSKACSLSYRRGNTLTEDSDKLQITQTVLEEVLETKGVYSAFGWRPSGERETCLSPPTSVGGAPSTKAERDVPLRVTDRAPCLVRTGHSGWACWGSHVSQPHSEPLFPLLQPERLPWPLEPKCTRNPSQGGSQQIPPPHPRGLWDSRAHPLGPHLLSK